MDTASLRNAVQDFQERTAHGSEADCLAPWYLHQTFQLPETAALTRTGEDDCSVHAFHLDPTSGPTLVCVQAKYSESPKVIVRAFREIESALPGIAEAVSAAEPTLQPQRASKLLVNLAAELQKLDSAARAALKIEFHILHLCAEDPAFVSQRFKEPKARLRAAIADALPDHRCSLREVAPRDLGAAETVIAPAEEVFLPVAGAHTVDAGEGGRMFVGVGKLASLVDMYQTRRDDLFSRNVRYFLSARKNVEKGPAGKMRITLRQMCVDGSVEPERFAMFHNGVTIFTQRATQSDGGLRLRDPYVLNGCQTIKNAFLFKAETKGKLQDSLWARVTVPVRIIETSDEELVRTVTVNNNRQNSMSPAALRANDPVQIRLERRLKERRIPYQRQEGAFDALEMQEALEELYENGQGTYVDIVELGRALAAAGGEINLAQHPTALFESDAAYERTFSQRRLSSTAFLVFLQNLSNVLRVVLTKEVDLERKDKGPRPSALVYQALCLLVRYFAREKMLDHVLTFGRHLYVGKKGDPFRAFVGKQLRSRKSGIRDEMNRQFMGLESSNQAVVQAAFEKTANELRLKPTIDVFESFEGLGEDEPLAAEAVTEPLD